MLRRASHRNLQVILYKEGDRSRQVTIPVCLHYSHAQSEWLPFLKRVMHELELGGIDGIHEDMTRAPVARIATLVDGGLYFARPTEIHALVSSLVGEGTETFPAWLSVQAGLQAKRDLRDACDFFETIKRSSPSPEQEAIEIEAADDRSDDHYVWTMRVKQGFKCRVYQTPECRPNEVMGVLEMLSTLTLTTDWGEAMENHPLRGDAKGSKVLAMATPYEGFVQRRPLEDFGDTPGDGDTVKVIPPTPAFSFTQEERRRVIHAAGPFPEILRTMLKRGAYFKGASAVHDMLDIHGAALRASATKLRKDPDSREELLACGGLDLFFLVLSKFREDICLCEYGCWVFAAFAGGGNPDFEHRRFQDAIVEAGVFDAIGEMTTGHPDQRPLRRYALGAIAVISEQNASASARLLSVEIHVTVAEDAMRRWPNDPEMCCLGCWVLQSVVSLIVSPAAPSMLPRSGENRYYGHVTGGRVKGAIDGKGSTNVTVQDAANGQPSGGTYAPRGEDHERKDSSSAEARLLQLAEETKVRHHDNEETHRAASNVVRQLLILDDDDGDDDDLIDPHDEDDVLKDNGDVTAAAHGGHACNPTVTLGCA